MVTAHPPTSHRGVALLLMLIAVAVLGLLATQLLQKGMTAHRRVAEQDLLYTGELWERALKSYVDSTPGPAALGPRAVGELLRDPRTPSVRRHLRQLPFDPLTGNTTWGEVHAPDGQIIGIYSLADGRPIQQAGFEGRRAAFNGATQYAQWVFGGLALPAASASAPAGAASASGRVQ